MAFNIGVNVLEVDGRVAPTIVAAPVSVAGFLVTSERGIPDLPVSVRGLTDYVNAFGRYGPPSGYGIHAVQGFFDNGGTDSVVVRVAGAGAQPANVTLKDRAAAPTNTVRITAGARGRADPGTWGNGLSVIVADHPRASSAIPAQIIGTVTEPFNLAPAVGVNQTLQVTANGAAAATTITFDPATPDFANIAAASAAEVAASINRQTTQVRAAVTPNQQVVIAGAVAGSSSHIAVTAGPTATTLGLTTPAADTISTALVMLQGVAGLRTGSAVRVDTPGSIVGNPLAAAPLNLSGAGPPELALNVYGTTVRIVFSAADFASAQLSSALIGEIVSAIDRKGQGQVTAGLTFDSRLVIRSTAFGPQPAGTFGLAAVAAGSIDVSGPLGLGAGAVVVAQGQREYHQVSAVSEASGFVILDAALGGVSVIVARLQSVEFDLAVRRGGDEVERFESLSMQSTLDYNVVAVINDQDRGSRFITVTDLGSVSGVGANAPAERRDAAGRLAAWELGNANGAAALTFTAGVDGTPNDAAFVGDPAQRTGLYAFDTQRIQLLAIPDTTAPGVTAAALAYCERRGDAMFVGTTPYGYDLDGAKTYAAGFRARKVFGALYWPWIEVVNPLDTTGNKPRLAVPPVGHVLGVYARTADTRGVWKAPAGDEALIRNALSVERDITDVEHTDLVKNGSVDAIRAIPGSGIIIDSSRTLSTDTRWLFIGTRRLFNFVKSSLRDGLRWVVQEPHSDELRRAVRFNVVTPFLLGLWRQGAFGSDPAEEVFTVICDASNNPPAEVNLGNFKVEVYFYPVKPAETIIIVVGQQESGASASEG